MKNDLPTAPPIFECFSIKDTLKKASEKLATISDTPRLDAELLLSHCLEKSQTYLHTWPEIKLSKKQNACFQSLLDKRTDDYPVAYLLGKKDFWTLDLKVSPDVLIPRPETELLVETALEKMSQIENPSILDLGTGSGAIALAIASERKDASIIACDKFEKALVIAKENAERNNLRNRVSFIQSDWFSSIDNQKFDLIISNPPYITPDDPHLMQSIRHEPLSALTSERNGMRDIETIIEESFIYIKSKGWLLIEHGYNQSEAVLSLYRQKNYINVKSLEDISNIPRISIAQKT